MNGQGEWRFSPAYDVTYNYGQNGEQSMSVDGYGKNIPEKSFFELAYLCELDEKSVKQIFAEISEAISYWGSIAIELGIQKNSIADIQKHLDKQYKQYKSIINSHPKSLADQRSVQRPSLKKRG
jgi:serine/threonine-protein kinase HipA